MTLGIVRDDGVAGVASGRDSAGSAPSAGACDTSGWGISSGTGASRPSSTVGDAGLGAVARPDVGQAAGIGSAGAGSSGVAGGLELAAVEAGRFELDGVDAGRVGRVPRTSGLVEPIGRGAGDGSLVAGVPVGSAGAPMGSAGDWAASSAGLVAGFRRRFGPADPFADDALPFDADFDDPFDVDAGAGSAGPVSFRAGPGSSAASGSTCASEGRRVPPAGIVDADAPSLEAAGVGASSSRAASSGFPLAPERLPNRASSVSNDRTTRVGRPATGGRRS